MERGLNLKSVNQAAHPSFAFPIGRRCSRFLTASSLCLITQWKSKQTRKAVPWIRNNKWKELNHFLMSEILKDNIYEKWRFKKSLSNNAAAAAAKSLQSCPTLCDPIDGGPPGSLSLGFSRQEHWSGLPLPSPMHESEKWKWSRSVVSDPQWPHGLQPSRLFRPWDFPRKSTGVGWHCLLHYLIILGIIYWVVRLWSFKPGNS